MIVFCVIVRNKPTKCVKSTSYGIHQVLLMNMAILPYTFYAVRRNRSKH